MFRGIRNRILMLLLLFAVIMIGTRCDAQEIIKTLKPLSVRGVNYYPRDTPWPGIWRVTTPATWDYDMALAQALSVNTVRTFLIWDTEAGLIDDNGNVSPEYLEKFDKFLSVAWAHGIRTVICFDNWSGKPEASWKRAISAFVVPHKNDGRILMWDLINEPGGSDGPLSSPVLIKYIDEACDYIKSLDPNHLTTIGLCWQVDQLAKIQLPDITQYHEYASKAELWSQGITRITSAFETIQRSAPGRPIVIGEFGSCTGKGQESEDDQAIRYGLILHAAQQGKIAGTMAWCLLDFTPSWVGAAERGMGVYRTDWSLKPAGQILKHTYARWADISCNSTYNDDCNSVSNWQAGGKAILQDPHTDDLWFKVILSSGSYGVITSKKITIDSSTRWLCVSLSDISAGAKASVKVTDLSSNGGEYTVIKDIVKPGAYDYDLRAILRSRSQWRLIIHIELQGHEGSSAEFDRISLSDTEPSSPKPAPIPRSYNPTNGHYYQSVAAPSEGISWADANTAAKSMTVKGMSGHLATITSADELKFIIDHCPSIHGAWIGGTQDKGSEEPAGGWKWVTGEPWSYTNWAKAQPDNWNGAEDRLQLYLPGGVWNDCAGTEHSTSYIAEFEP